MSARPQRQLVLLELNEINLDVAARYVERLGLRNFARLFEQGVRRTSSERRYEELEPWIQWVSAHTGLTAEEHGIFRLGDIVGSRVPQIFEALEAKGLSVGAVSPMNAENRLAKPAYFLPDPWTQTPADPSFWSARLSRAVSQAVNDNSAGRITPRSALTLAAGLARFARPRHYGLYARLARRARGAPWRKALLLDLFLHDLHMRLLRRHRPDFSTLFLNAGAHIQHHYFHSSAVADRGANRNPAWYVAPHEDPMAEMFEVYDAILGDYLDRTRSSLLVATGLTQRPYPKVTFYWRPLDHAAFLSALGIRAVRVVPRMTRDFLAEFSSAQEAAAAQAALHGLRASSDGVPLFEEIDNRGDSLFVTLTYPNDIAADVRVIGAPGEPRLREHVVFVAVKNGMHDPDGFVCCRGEVARHAPPDGAHVKSLHDTIHAFFA
jgi:hypothetical protein